MREGTTSRVMAADRPYGEFYDFYSVSPEYFGYTLIICAVNLVHGCTMADRKTGYGFKQAPPHKAPSNSHCLILHKISGIHKVPKIVTYNNECHLPASCSCGMS
jgi:hypothetical protein